jgi:hypothetical protein
LVTLAITVFPAGALWLRDTVCQNVPYNKPGFGPLATNIAGEFTYTRTEKTAIHNCDSIITFKLTVNPAITNIISDEVTAGEAYKK